MIPFEGKGILLDIEGTTSSIRFVYDVMFPYARRKLREFVQRNWGSVQLADACRLIARDVGHPSFEEWSGENVSGTTETQRMVCDEVERQMDADLKLTGLKTLQGLIWQDGFEMGEMVAHVYDDVPPALKVWKERELDVRIYSSGSIKAQKLFFRHTCHGNLLPYFRGHYDTTTGPKRESGSYARIAEHFGLPAREILFLSDIPAELDAARAVSMKTGLCTRPENDSVHAEHGHPELIRFTEVQC